MSSTIPTHVYEVRPRKDKRGVHLISDSKIVLGGTAALHTCRLWGAVIFFGSFSTRWRTRLGSRRFQFQKCGQFFIGTHNETLSVAMDVRNPDRSPVGINR